MNQVLSFDRMVYFGYIFEESGLLAQNMQASPTSKKARPGIAFGARAVDHKEIRKMQDDLVKNYNVSPIKIRKAGIEEMQSLKREEQMAQSRNHTDQSRGNLTGYHS